MLLALIVIGAATLFISSQNAASVKIERDKKTAAALALAKEALISYATNALTPGTLPCPDTDNDGIADSCGGGGITKLGRLPWKTLKLPALRDGSGECLWYVVSGKFKNNPLTQPLNSDTNGQVTVMANDGTTALAGSSPASLAIAVIIAPGALVQGQDRTVSSTSVCGGNDTANNYLDNSMGIDNAHGDSTEKLIAADESNTFNDRLLFISPEQLFPSVEKRVIQEARFCLDQFSSQPGANGHLPWATPINDVTNFSDVSNTRFGRIPKTLVATNASLGTSLAWPNPTGVSATCFAAGTWWDNWRLHLFYHVATAYEPKMGSPDSCSIMMGNCLTVNSTSSVKAVAALAGRAWPANPNQSSRATNMTSVPNFLETDPITGINNATGGITGHYAKRQISMTSAANFNDQIECLQTTGQPPCH